MDLALGACRRGAALAQVVNAPAPTNRRSPETAGLDRADRELAAGDEQSDAIRRLVRVAACDQARISPSRPTRARRKKAERAADKRAGRDRLSSASVGLADRRRCAARRREERADLTAEIERAPVERLTRGWRRRRRTRSTSVELDAAELEVAGLDR